MPPPDPALHLKSLSEWWADMGAPGDVVASPSRHNNAQTGGAETTTPVKAAAKPPSPKRINPKTSDPIAAARAAARAADSLSALQAAVEGFEGCDLKETARSTVFADGAAEADVMIIGEAPGRDEDAAGKPFVGRAGQLLDKMFAAIGLERSATLYITNILSWRPPGNRNPEPDETAMCLPFVQRHIELVRPKILVVAGRTAAHALLPTTEGIMKLRGRRRDYAHDGLHAPIACLPMLHPAYLLRRPADKSKAWADLLTLAKMADELGAARRR